MKSTIYKSPFYKESAFNRIFYDMYFNYIDRNIIIVGHLNNNTNDKYPTYYMPTKQYGYNTN